MPEFAVQRGPLKLNLGANTSNNLIVRFRSQEVPMVRLGQRVFDAVEYVDFVTVQHPGENLSVIDRPVKDEDKRRWPQEWERYQAGKDQVPNGIPIATLFAGHPGIIRALERENVLTVEQLAGLSATAIQSIGMGWESLMTDEELKRVADLERQTAALDRQMKLVVRALDSALRRLALPPILDDQMMA